MNELTKELQLVDKESALSLEQSFVPLFNAAKEWKQKASTIIVKDASQVDLMQQAREARLNLKDIRVKVEKIRVEMKAESLRKGKAIDGIANIIKYLIYPIEDHLKKQEDFIIIQENQKKDKLETKRIAELEKYQTDTSLYNLREMDEERYTQIVEMHKKAFEQQQKEEKIAEEQRIAAEKKRIEDQARIAKENEKLRKEAAEREKQLQEERNRHEKILAAEKQKAEKEKALREKIEAEKLAEWKKKEAAETMQKEKIHQAQLAPDKEKLDALAAHLGSIQMPQLKSAEAIKVRSEVMQKLNELISFIRLEALAL